MPAPRENTIPDSENWKFIHRFPDYDSVLKPLAINLVAFDKQPYEPHKAKILSFLGGSENSRVQSWSALWITIIQTLGLAYTTSQDNLLHTTALAKYLAETADPKEAFYYYWALRFQFPWAQSKHKEWKELGKVVQPIVFMMQHLVALYEKSLTRNEPPFNKSYLTFEEVILILMKSSRSDIYAVHRNVNQILQNRRTSFDYTPYHVTGYTTVEEQFANRTRLFFESVGFVKFNSSRKRVILDSQSQLLKLVTFLSYIKPPIPVSTDEGTRVNYFEKAFNTLSPHPTHLYSAINIWQ